MALSWGAVAGAQSYVIHFGDSPTGANDVVMYYTEATSLTINNALTGETLHGKTKYAFVQAFNVKGQGSNDVEKAQWLNTTQYGSPWSAPVTTIVFP